MDRFCLGAGEKYFLSQKVKINRKCIFKNAIKTSINMENKCIDIFLIFYLSSSKIKSQQEQRKDRVGVGGWKMILKTINMTRNETHTNATFYTQTHTHTHLHTCLWSILNSIVFKKNKKKNTIQKFKEKKKRIETDVGYNERFSFSLTSGQNNDLMKFILQKKKIIQVNLYTHRFLFLKHYTHTHTHTATRTYTCEDVAYFLKHANKSSS